MRTTNLVMRLLKINVKVKITLCNAYKKLSIEITKDVIVKITLCNAYKKLVMRFLKINVKVKITLCNAYKNLSNEMTKDKRESKNHFMSCVQDS